jgi:hypothetical protein
VGGAAAEEGRDASSALSSDEVGSGNTDKAMHAASRVHTKSTGALAGRTRRAGRRRGRGAGVGCVSDLSAAAPEIPLDVELGSANRGVPGGSKGESPKRNTGEEKGGGGGTTTRSRARRRRRKRTGTRRRMGRAAWTRRTSAAGNSFRRRRIDFHLLSQGNNDSK